MTAPLRVVIYSRVSSKDQLGNNNLPTQREAMTRHAEREGYEIVRAFEERGKSGKTLNRPKLQEMLSFVEVHPGRIDAVLCYEDSRFSRDTADHLAVRTRLTAAKVRVISVTQPVTDDPYGEFVETLHVALAKLDNDQRGQRSKAGMAAAVERGRWCWQAPVGYFNCGRNASPSLKADPDRGPLVAEAFDRVAFREDPSDVHTDLASRGLTTRRGLPIGRTTFYTLLRNPVYVGRLETALGSIQGDWEPLVEVSVWQRVKGMLHGRDVRTRTQGEDRRRGKRAYRRLRPGFELRAFLVCAECGRKLTGGVTKGHAYLNCPRGHVRSRANVLEERFCSWLALVRPNQVVLERLEKAIRAVWDEQRAALEKRRAAEQRELLEIESKLAKLDAAFLYERTIDRETYEKHRTRLRAQREREGLAAVENDLDQLDLDEVIKFGMHLLSQPERLWQDATPEERVTLQRGLFPDGIVVDRALDFSTPSTSMASMPYVLFEGRQDGMASPMGFEPMFWP